jgi:hypothetical protein
MRQRPPVHAAVEGEGAEHTMPQPPQLPLSVCSLRHALPQKDSPVGQAHWPLWQVVPPVQTLHAAPAVPHIEVVWLAYDSHTEPLQHPPGHEVASQTHVPPEQRCPEAHGMVQAPQLLMSVCSLTHVLLHKDHPNGQAHVPLWQVWPPVQTTHVAPAVPHVESAWLSHRLASLQQPLGHEVPSQAHAPREQYCPEAHVLPQRPQLIPLVFRSVSHPSSVMGAAGCMQLPQPAMQAAVSHSPA